MADATAATLSQHLLHEADRFLVYPVRTRRTAGTKAMHKALDKNMRRLLEWRKSFAPTSKSEDMYDWLFDHVMLDQAYCRAMLQMVPEFVERTQSLKKVTLTEIADTEAFVYLREAANCYISGLPLATVALSRAAVENRLRNVCSKHFPKEAINTAEFIELIDRFSKGLLPLDGRNLAHVVRTSGNAVLHPKDRNMASFATALKVFEAARTVIQMLHHAR
jgi:hypothetical protein